ncbi:hypothetical protein GCK32_015702, partial [Trichostrongylus colubriformis]
CWTVFYGRFRLTVLLQNILSVEPAFVGPSFMVAFA